MKTIVAAMDAAAPLDSRIVDAFINDEGNNPPSVDDILLIDDSAKLGSPWNTAVIDRMAERFLGQIQRNEYEGVSPETTDFDLESLAHEIKLALTKSRATRVRKSKMTETQWRYENKKIQKGGRRNTRRHDVRTSLSFPSIFSCCLHSAT